MEARVEHLVKRGNLEVFEQEVPAGEAPTANVIPEVDAAMEVDEEVKAPAAVADTGGVRRMVKYCE